jgi:Domain of unknown function (DUF4190)
MPAGYPPPGYAPPGTYSPGSGRPGYPPPSAYGQAPGYPAPRYPAPGYATAGYPGAAVAPAGRAQAHGDMDMLAVLSLILGILGLVTCLGITAPLALFLGLASRTKIREAKGVLRGSALAMAGIILGAVGTVELIVAVVLVIVIAVRAG